MKKLYSIVFAMLLGIMAFAQNFVNHTVARGETLDSVAAKYGVSKSVIASDNNLAKDFHVGGVIKIRVEETHKSKFDADNSSETKSPVSYSAPQTKAAAPVSYSSSAEFGPKAGTFSLEVQFNPFSTDFNTFKLLGTNGATLQGRYFFDKNNALRFGLGLNGEVNKIKGPSGKIPEQKESYEWESYKLRQGDKSSDKRGEFSLGLGYERHWMVSRRVDVYAGAAATFAYQWASYYDVSNMGNYDYNTKRFSKTWTNTTKYSGKNSKGDNANLNFSAGVFTGVDVYIVKGLYVGAELGFNMKTTKNLNYTEVYVNNQDGVHTETNKYLNNTSDFEFGLKMIPALRLGWSF